MKTALAFLTRIIILFITFGSLNLGAVYIARYTTTDNGGILYTGNTLGLSKAAGQNNAGTADAIGAFITTQTPLPVPVGNYANDGTDAGTTLNYLENSSTAMLDLPSDSTVLYAELIWAGSYSFYGQIAGTQPDGPVNITTPLGQNFSVMPDPLTAQTAITPSYGCPGPTPTPCQCPCGNYVRSSDVTSIIQAGGAGSYTVGGIAATVAAGDDTHNSAGWTLAVIYQNPNMFTYNMTIFVGCEQASSLTNMPATVSGFCAPPTGTLSGRLFISAIEVDANKTGDSMLFGGSLPLTAANKLSGTNNPINNFFASQINSLLPLTFDPLSGKYVAIGSSQLDTRGSYGTQNQDPFTGVNIPAGRQGYDITSIDISSTLTYNQTQAYALGTTSGDDYTINSLAIEIQVGAPTLHATKLVDNQESINALVGDTVTFSFVLENLGTADAFNTLFKDVLEPGLEFVPGSFTFNSIAQPDPDLITGFSIGNLAVNQSVTIEFMALITDYPLVQNIFYNNASLDYEFLPCQGSAIALAANTNIVEIILPCECQCCPGVPFISCSEVLFE